jgi:biopolymer transport protein TolR
VELPKTEAGSLQDQTEPLTVTIRADGQIFVKEDEIPFGNLAPRLKEMTGPTTKPIYVRADGKAPYAIVAQVMAALSTSGFTSINLITDTGGPSSGATPAKSAPIPGEPDTP